MREILKLGLVLLIITSVAAFVLGVTNDVTQAVIQEKALEANKEFMQALLPDADEFQLLDDPSITDRDLVAEAYEGLKGGEVVGYTVKVKPSGYGGEIEMIVGMTAEGKISGVKVVNQSETPGLGSKITDASFIDQFLDKDTSTEFQVTKGGESGDQYIQAISGATVSSNAATSGVNAARALFEEVLKK